MFENIETRIQYKLARPRLPAVIGEDAFRCLCHREDCHKDGSSTHYYYIELTKEQFLAIGGQELKTQGAQDED